MQSVIAKKILLLENEKRDIFNIYTVTNKYLYQY